jgi:hypothetical protein
MKTWRLRLESSNGQPLTAGHAPALCARLVVVPAPLALHLLCSACRCPSRSRSRPRGSRPGPAAASCTPGGNFRTTDSRARALSRFLALTR